MKRSILVAFAMVAACILSLQTCLASAQTYLLTNYLGPTGGVTVDGKWTSASEWTDAMTAPSLPSSILFREKWEYPGTTNIVEYVLVEFYTDNTNTTGDFFQYCLDPLANGGSAPQADDVLINYTGHNRSGLTLYKGNGTGWARWTGWTYGTDVAIADSRTGSQMNATSHWIIELMMDRSNPNFDTSGASTAYQPLIRVAVYDQNNTSQGVQSWPPSTSQNAPSTWGTESGQYAAIPESLTILPITLISFIAVAVSIYFFHRKPRAKNLGIGRID